MVSSFIHLRNIDCPLALDTGETGEGQKDQVLILRVAFEKKKGNLFRCTKERVLLDINKPTGAKGEECLGWAWGLLQTRVGEASVQVTLAWGPGTKEGCT